VVQKAKKTLFFILKFAISFGMLYYVLSKTGAEKVFQIIKTINPVAFAAAVFIYLISVYIAAIRWRLLLPQEFKTKRLFSFALIGSFFNTFLPGIIGGDAVKTYYLYKEINSGSMSLSSVFMDRYIGFLSLMFIALCSFVFGFRYISGTFIEWLLPAIILGFIIASVMLFGLRLGKKIKLVSDFYDYFDQHKNQRPLITKTFFLSIAIQTMSILSMYVIALGLGQQASIIYYFIFFPIITVVSTLPISISGLGVREGSFVLLFGIIGISPEMATAMSLAWFISIACGGLAGLFEYLRIRR
jgi:uncharacterized membrane protein YbhN (UPF0104 family)